MFYFIWKYIDVFYYCIEKYIVNQEHILCLNISGFPLIKKVKNSWHVRWIENMKENSKSFRLVKKNEAIRFLH